MAGKFITNQDIIREYSDTVAGALATGWTVFTPTMGGSQGEEAHIDLINKDHTVVWRVLLYKDSDWGDGSAHKYIISVHSYVPADVHCPEETWDSLYNYNAGYCTIWNEKGVEVSKRVFYGMSQGNHSWERVVHYTTDANVPAQAKARREYKWKNRLYDHSDSKPWRRDEPKPAQFNIDRLVKFVRKHGGRGYGNCRAEEIQGVRKYNRDGVVRYMIDFKGAKKQLAF